MLETPAQESGGLAPAELERLVDGILAGDTFRSAPNMRTLLQYLWQHRGEPITEYAIAVDALGRPADFDPRADATVRVQVGRLRAKLKEFYDAEGSSFPLRLSVPVGHHEIKWAVRPAGATASVSAAAVLPAFYRGILLGVAATMLAVLCVVAFFQSRNLKASLPAPLPPLPRFWQSFLAGGKPTVVVVPSPTFFQWPDEHLYVRDLNISNFPGLAIITLPPRNGKKMGTAQTGPNLRQRCCHDCGCPVRAVSGKAATTESVV